jgi:uncharacterized protein YggE
MQEVQTTMAPPNTLALLLLMTARPLLAQSPPPLSEIRTSGSATHIVQPDRVVVTVSVQTNRPTPSAAGVANATLFDSVRRAIIALGVPRDSITTQGYSVEMQVGPYAKDTSFTASNSVVVRLRRLLLIGRVIDTALTSGATRITGVGYSADDPWPTQQRALDEAVKRAHQSALTMAKAAGGRLGRLLELTTETPGYSDVSLREGISLTEAAATAAPTSITPGPLTVAAWVQGRWEFLPGSD